MEQKRKYWGLHGKLIAKMIYVQSGTDKAWLKYPVLNIDLGSIYVVWVIYKLFPVFSLKN